MTAGTVSISAAEKSEALANRKASALFSCPTYFLPCGMMRRCRGYRTVKRVKTAWLGNTVAMLHDLRIVNSRGSQWADEQDG
jgi:hypothetical protein